MKREDATVTDMIRQGPRSRVATHSDDVLNLEYQTVRDSPAH